jgi:hypothetical protein
MHLVERLKYSTSVLVASTLFYTGCATSVIHRPVKRYPDQLPKITFSQSSTTSLDEIKSFNREGEYILTYMDRLSGISSRIESELRYNPRNDLSRLEQDILRSQITSKSVLSKAVREYGYILEEQVIESYGMSKDTKTIVLSGVWLGAFLGVMSSFDMDEDKDFGEDKNYSINGARFLTSIGVGLLIHYLIEEFDKSSTKRYNRRTRYVPLSR